MADEREPSDVDGGSDTDVETRERVRVKEPVLFRVYLLNDDYTTMDFVVFVLESIFKKTPAEAVRVMLTVHNQGRGVCGVYPKQIAEAKIESVHQRARAGGYPLRCVMEEA